MHLRGPAGGSELLFNNSVDKGGERGARVVERSLHSVEWSEPDSSQLLPHHRDRCLEKRVGGSVQWSLHGGTVDPRGETHAHQLPRAPGSPSGSEMFCKSQKNLTVHLKMESISALTYINKLGGTIS